MPVLEFGLIVAMTLSLVLNIFMQVFTDGMVRMLFFLFVRLLSYMLCWGKYKRWVWSCSRRKQLCLIKALALS